MKFNSLQALRGIAAILVVLSHCNNLGKSQHIFGAGFMGVDLFFVLSGFVLFYGYGSMQGWRNALTFMWRRVLRIVPMLWLVMLASGCAIYGLNIPFAEAWRNWLVLPSHNQFIIPSWSLCHEVWFYLLFAVCIALPRELGLIVLGMIIGSTLYYNAMYIWVWPWGEENAFNEAFMFSPRNIEFLSGCAAAYMVSNARLPKLMWAGTAWLVCSVPFALYFMHVKMYEMKWHTVEVAMFGAGAFMLVYGLASRELSGKMKVPRFLTFLGDASYSIYLTHMVLIKPAVYWLSKTPIARIPCDEFAEIAIAIIVVALGCVTHVLVEKPMLKLWRKK